jgi:subtilisin family serine protease
MPVSRYRPVLLAFAILLFSVPNPASAESVSLLVKSKVPLTQDVIASIAGQGQVTFVWPEINSMALTVPSSQVASISANSNVEFVEADDQGSVMRDKPKTVRTKQPLQSVVVPLSTSTTPVVTWNQDMANTQGPAETGRGVTVAVVDAGLPQNWQDFLPPDCVDLDHAAGFGAEGWGDPHAVLNTIGGVGGHIGLFPHGLACSSVIVGFPSELGPIAGAAPDVKILPVRVINQFNFGWFSWFTAGIMYVANLKASGAIPGPLVISFSIQAFGSSQVLKSAIDYAISQGVVFVTIAGNFNPSAYISFPGRLPEAITAGACGWVNEGLPPDPWFFGDVPESDPSQVYVAPFSGREPPSVPAGSEIDVLAPGSNVYGEWLFGPGFSEGREVAFDAVDNFIYGTSFAGPHVAGIVARMLEKNPGLTQSQIEGILRSTAMPIPPGVYFYPWDDRATGSGLVQGAEAVAATPVPAGRVLASASMRVLTRTGSIPVEFRAEGSGPCTYSLFDVQGRLVRRWVSSGTATTRWDGRRGDGTPAASGVYFVHAEGPGVRASAKVVVAR